MPGLGPALFSEWCGDMAGGAGEDVGTDVDIDVAVEVGVSVGVAGEGTEEEATDDTEGPFDCIDVGTPRRPAAGER